MTKKNKNLVWIVLVVIALALFVLPKFPLFAVGDVYATDSSKLTYQTFRSGSQCSSNFYQSHSTYGKLYISDVTAVVIYENGGFIWNTPNEYCIPSVYFYEGASLPGTTYAGCPPYQDASTALNYPSSGTLSDGQGSFCKSIEQYCIDENLPNYQAGQDAYYDPNPSNGIPEIKCNAYCKPNLGTCIMGPDGKWESQICYSDGSHIVHKTCLDECADGECTGSEAIYIDIPPIDNLVIGEDLVVRPILEFHGAPEANEELIGTIYQNQQTIAGPVIGYTNSFGEAIIQFNDIQAIKGFANLVIIADIAGLPGVQDMEIYFDDALPANIFIPSTSGTYHFGDRVEVEVQLLIGGEGYPNNLIKAKIESGGEVVSETTDITDSGGYANLIFPSVEAIDEAILIVSSTVNGVEKISTSDMFFSGITILFEPTTESYTQSNKVPVVFFVEAKDALFRDISPELINNLQAITSLTQGTTSNEVIEYLGNGLYQISTDVEGTGVFLGKLAFEYEDIYFESPSIQITVGVVTLSIDTSKIAPLAYIGETETYEISFASSLGFPITPDAVEIIVSLPSGFEEETLTLNDLIKTGEGKYVFDYSFTQVEKHTFDIYLDKEGYTRGSARASVSVTSEEGDFGPGIGGISKWVWISLAGAIVLFFVMGRRKK